MSNGLPQTTVSDSSPSIPGKDAGRESLLEATKWLSVCATRREMVSVTTRVKWELSSSDHKRRGMMSYVRTL